MGEKDQKCYLFKKYATYVNSISSMIIPINTFLVLWREIEKSNVEIKEEKLEMFTYILTYDLIENKRINMTKKIDLFFKRLGCCGYGSFTCILKNKRKVVIKAENPILFEKEDALLGKDFNVIGSYVANIFKSFLKYLFRREINDYNIVSKNGMKYIEFFLSDKEVDYNKWKTKYELKSWEDILSNNSELNSLTKKILLNKQLVLDDGVLNIWNVEVMAFPLFIFENMGSIRNVLNTKFKEIGVIQGEKASQLQDKLFGNFSSNEKLMHAVLDQSEFVGLGVMKNLEFDQVNGDINYYLNTVMAPDNLLKWYLLGLTEGVLKYIYGRAVDGYTEDNFFRAYITEKSKFYEINEKEIYYLLNLKNFLK